MVDFSLTNKIALITGASRGIGEAIALTLSEYGAHCILVSRKIEGLEAVKEKIEQAGGIADAIAGHTGSLEQINLLFEQIKNKFGRLDILINNAATNPYFGEMIGADEAVWNKTNEVNLKGPFFHHPAGRPADGRIRRRCNRQCLLHQRCPAGPDAGHLFHHQSRPDLNDQSICHRACTQKYPGQCAVAGSDGNPFCIGPHQH